MKSPAVEANVNQPVIFCCRLMVGCIQQIPAVCVLYFQADLDFKGAVLI
ncbi:MAG: hypothetical protein ACQETG_11845 [Thermodesulfobacteriota bacterium]